MKTRTSYALALLLLTGFVCGLAVTGQVQVFWSSLSGCHPVVEYPAKLDLGEHEIGDVAAAPLAVANRGRGDLVIDQIRTDCSCAGLEQEKGGKYSRIDSLRLKAGERANLLVRVSVRGVPIGTAMLNMIEFRTNDPNQPVGRIEAVVRRVTGGVSCTPPSVVFGRLLVGEEARYTVDVRDAAAAPRSVERVTSSDPDRVTVRWQPDTGHRLEPGKHPAGELLGRIEVTVATREPGHVGAKVHICLAGEARQPDALTVAGRVAAPIEMSPSSLVLPKSSSAGLVYSASCVCRSNNGEPLTLTVESIPSGFTAEVLAEGGPESRSILVTWDPQAVSGKGAGPRQLIRLRAKAGKDQALLELPILLQM